jgi:hypothetical protein
VLGALDMVMAGEARTPSPPSARPATTPRRETPMGFCLFGNVAIAAKRALDHHGLARRGRRFRRPPRQRHAGPAVGRGARALRLQPPDAALARHRRADERGAHDNVLNLPLPPGTDGARFRASGRTHALPRLDAFAPELVLISAGFDAHRADPLAQLALEVEDFAWITQKLCDLADTHARGGWFRCSKAAMISTRWRLGRGACAGIDGAGRMKPVAELTFEEALRELEGRRRASWSAATWRSTPRSRFTSAGPS